MVVCFCKQKTAYEMRISDWSSDVCSSDLSDEQDKPTLTRKPLGLKRTVEAGQVQQQFSHGRRNTVVVEVKRRRVLGRPGEAAPAPRSAERRVGKACDSPCRSRWSQYT